MLRAPRGEVDILHPDTAPAWTRKWIPFWSDLFAPYIKAGKFQSIEGDIVLRPVSVRLQLTDALPATRPMLSRAKDRHSLYWVIWC